MRLASRVPCFLFVPTRVAPEYGAGRTAMRPANLLRRKYNGNKRQD
jgi:hypothetical protein